MRESPKQECKHIQRSSKGLLKARAPRPIDTDCYPMLERGDVVEPKRLKEFFKELFLLPTVLTDIVVQYVTGRAFYQGFHMVKRFKEWNSRSILGDHLLIASKDDKQATSVHTYSLLEGEPAEIQPRATLSGRELLWAFEAYPEWRVFVDRAGIRGERAGEGRGGEVVVPGFANGQPIEMAGGLSKKGLVYLMNPEELVLVDLERAKHTRLPYPERSITGVSLNEAGTLLAYIPHIGAHVKVLRVDNDGLEGGEMKLCEHLTLDCVAEFVMFLNGNILALLSEGEERAFQFYNVPEGEGEGEKAIKLDATFTPRSLYNFSYNAIENLVVTFVKEQQQEGDPSYPPISIEPFFGETGILILNPKPTNSVPGAVFKASHDLAYLLETGSADCYIHRLSKSQGQLIDGGAVSDVNWLTLGEQ